jgi:hypothetical protein
MGGTKMQKNFFYLIVGSVLTAFGSSVFAYDWSTNPGKGTSDAPYQISNVEQLTAIGSDSVVLSKYFVLTEDIDLLGTTYSAPLIAPDADIITPDFQGTAFSGFFDGQNHSIENLTIVAQSGRDIIGLFGKIEHANIQNLILTDVSIQATQSNYVAAMVGQASSATLLSNCHVNGSITGKNYLAGLIAYLNSAEVSRCSFDGTVTGSVGTFSIGGLIGASNAGTIRRCLASGGVIAGNLSSSIGGLIGYINGTTVYSCAADMDISCGDNSSQLGGLIGTFDLFCDIRNCYSLGSIRATLLTDNIGGLIGNIVNSQLYVQNSYSACSVTGGNGSNTIGGLIGHSGGLAPANCYFLAQADGGGPNNGIGIVLTATQMKQKASFVGFDFLGQTTDGLSDHWRLCTDGVRFPSLSWLSGEMGDFACPNGTNLDDLEAIAVHWLEVSGELEAVNEACDTNGDSKIDLADWLILSQNWLRETTVFSWDNAMFFFSHWLSTSATWEEGDYTGDGKVDLNDWTILSANYHGQ